MTENKSDFSEGMTLEKLNAMIKSENIWHETQVSLDITSYEAKVRTEQSRHEKRLQELEMIIQTLKDLPRGEQ